MHGLRGKPGKRAKPSPLKQRILARYEKRYPNFGPSLAAEYLAAKRMTVAHETLRRWPSAQGKPRLQRRRGDRPILSWLLPNRTVLQMDQTIIKPYVCPCKPRRRSVEYFQKNIGQRRKREVQASDCSWFISFSDAFYRVLFNEFFGGR